MTVPAAPVRPTTFFREIDRNRRNSILLVAIVALVLAALGAAIGYATGFGWGGVIIAARGGDAHERRLRTSPATPWCSPARARTRSIPANPTEPYKQLVNVVTEMRLASGLPMPRLYVIPDSAPNAFATGRDPKHASVAATTGLLEKLDREELQGVMAHEMSHVGNLDIRFALLVGVLVGSIALLADWFLRFTFWGGGRGRDNDRGGGGGAGRHPDGRRPWCWRSSRRSSAARCSWRSAARASRWPM